MLNIGNNMYALVKKTKKLSILLILVMLFSSVFNIGIIAEEDPKPDLTINGLVVHGDIAEGEEIIFEATILNQENVEISEDIKVAMYLDYNWGTSISIATIHDGLSGDASDSVNLSWTAIEPGVYMFSVFVDYPNEIVEEDENNNVRDIFLNVSERDTDLTFVDDEITIDGERRVGVPLTISAIATNTGKNTTEEITAALYINDAKNQETKIDGLSKGETYPLSFEWTPGSFGEYNVGIKLHSENLTAEQDDDNNHVWEIVSIDITRLKWWDTSWHYRKFYELTGVGNLTIEVNFTELLSDLNVVDKTFENDTITIIKYTIAGVIVGVAGNYSFNESEEFDNATNALGNLTWTVNESLYYCIYFDVKENTGVRIGRNETPDFNTSGTPSSIVFEASEEGWWSIQNGTFKNYYTPDDDPMSIQINTTALADTVVANFYYQDNLNHSVDLESDDNITWIGVSTFSDIGNWTVEIVASDAAGYQPENITYNFYVGLPDLTVTNITFTSSIPGSSPFYEGYNVNIEADVTVFNTTVYNVTVSLYINGSEEDLQPDLKINKDETKIVIFEYNFNQSGTYEVTVWVDPDNSTWESNEGNNSYSKTINISGIPDLGVVNISVPTNYFNEGDPVEIYANVTNTGNENATDYRVNLYCEQHGDNTMHYTSEINHTFVSVKINETKKVGLIWDSAEPGEWIVGVKILQNATKPDSNILNNSEARFDVRLKVNATEPPEDNDPVIEILEPDSLEEFEQNLPVEIIAKITDESGIKSVDIIITGPDKITYEGVMTKQENDKYSYTFEDTHLLKIYNFTITAVDDSIYNKESTESSNFTIIEDATPPEIDFVGVLPSVQLIKKDVTISCIVSDSSEVKSVQVTITYPNGDSEVDDMTSSSNDKKYYYTQSYEMLGKYIFYITTEDILGNEKEYEDEKVEFWITANLEDTDSDGMPDWWEEKYGFDPYDSADAAEDEDNDGYTNVEEYEGDMDPLEPLSLLQRIVLESKENWIYVLVSGILFIVIIALSTYGIRRRKT